MINAYNTALPMAGETTFTGVPGETGAVLASYSGFITEAERGLVLVELGEMKEFVILTHLVNGGRWISHRTSDHVEAIKEFKRRICRHLTGPE